MKQIKTEARQNILLRLTDNEEFRRSKRHRQSRRQSRRNDSYFVVLFGMRKFSFSDEQKENKAFYFGRRQNEWNSQRANAKRALMQTETNANEDALQMWYAKTKLFVIESKTRTVCSSWIDSTSEFRCNASEKAFHSIVNIFHCT